MDERQFKRAEFTEASSSSTSETGNNYYVFLSFRGPDTRNGFIDHLYQRLQDVGLPFHPNFVFRDDEELPLGEKIGENLISAIEHSKVSIPVISENYAASEWCLRELIHIMECKESRGQIVLPVLYKVKPYEVRELKGAFGEAFESRKYRFNGQVKQQGPMALKKALDLRVFESEKFANGREGELVKELVRVIMDEQQHDFLHEQQHDFLLPLPGNVVVIDDRVAEVMKLVDPDPFETQIIGICGIGGIGKTTLATNIYNKLVKKFEHHSFLMDIRETINRNGMEHIQNLLISDITGDHKSRVPDSVRGIVYIRSSCENKKVLIVLDDVGHQEHIDKLIGGCNFKSGSRIIITCRDKALLKSEYKCHELKEMNSKDSMLLFSLCAFEAKQPPTDFTILSSDIIATTGGLPLALEIIGSYLKGKDEVIWTETLQKLRKVPHMDVQKKLKLSYDSLENQEKRMFLDIACFFIGIDERIVTYLWNDLGLYPTYGLARMIELSLIKYGDNNELRMHDQLRDLGRAIVRSANKESWDWSRWDEEAMEVPKRERMKKMEDEAGEQAADMETSDRKYAIAPVQKVVEIDDCGKKITESPEMEVDDESVEEMEDAAGQRPVDMETSNRNNAIAAVQNVVGIDDRAKQITDLLEMEVSDEVRIIGVCGTDGIGKTTLAKAVYKRISSRFNSCSFLTEVEETTQSSGGIQFLQNKLIRDILEQDREDLSFDDRIEDFLDIFREMKVLIVVDAVEKPCDIRAIVGDRLQWFGPGSRVIVTSQNKEILKEYDSDKAPTYMVSELEDAQAFELFCKHAFRMQSSIPDYDGLSNCIVNATEKLPLAVEVIGSFLRGKSIQEWEKMEKSMKARLMNSQKTSVGLEDILDICYKEVNQQQKKIFLDIACFISDVDARIASYMWPNCYPSSGCILMPLAKIGENNELQMHRLLRCLGKRIFKQEGSGDPSSRRFCTQDMVLKAKNREKGIENVEARDSCLLTAASLASMPAISFLKLDGAKVSGDFAGAFPCLRWLCWQRCPLDFSAENFVLRELVILDLSWSKVTEDWRGWSEIKMDKLKVLNLSGCSDLLITPNFSDYKDLEILILEQCSHLVKLDPSIGHLKRLVSLNLKFCSQLNGLPVELGCTTALKELFIDGTSVRQIPISIGNLKQLEILSGLKCFPLTHLPSSICYLIALSELSLEGAKISELPSSLGELLKLRRLSLRDCRYLEKLPYSIGEMRSLEELDISATSISELPESIINLKSLRVLRMDSSFIRAFPGEIGNLTKLEELHASWCRSLKGAIPGDIEGLHRLRSLTLGHSGISSLPPELSPISSLHTLDLIQCNKIEELPKLPPSLICLRVSSKRMKAIPFLEDMKELEELCLSDGDPKAHLPPSKLPTLESNVKRMIDKQSFSILFPKLRKLELSLSQVIKLKFGLTDIPPLKRLKMLTPPGLSCRDVSELPKKLLAFKLYHSAIEEIEGLEGLEALKRLDISNCKIQNLNGIGQITSLRSLILSECNDLNLPDLSNLKSLKVLEIIRCKRISQIEGLEKLTSLEKLNISECPAEKSVQVQDALKHVKARFPVT